MSLDAAAQAMGTDDQAALAFYQALAAAELVLLLAHEPTGSDLSPQVFDLPSGALVLAFDSEDRLASWAREAGLGPQAYAALPGRVVAQLVAQNTALGLGLNFGAGTPSEMILPPSAMTWMAQLLDTAPQSGLARIRQVLPLGTVPGAMLRALQVGLAGAGGFAQQAVLARAAYDTGALAHVLAIFGADSKSEAPLARAVAEALAFSGLEAGALDVIFVAGASQVGAHILALGMNIALPPPPSLPDFAPGTPRAPGMDPSAPPRLK